MHSIVINKELPTRNIHQNSLSSLQENASFLSINKQPKGIAWLHTNIYT